VGDKPLCLLLKLLQTSALVYPYWYYRDDDATPKTRLAAPFLEKTDGDHPASRFLFFFSLEGILGAGSPVEEP